MHVICYHLGLVKQLASGLRQFITSTMVAWERLKKSFQRPPKRRMLNSRQPCKRPRKKRLTKSPRKLKTATPQTTPRRRSNLNSSKLETSSLDTTFLKVTSCSLIEDSPSS